MKKIKKGDNVIVIAGKDKGKKGVILFVLHKENKLFVEGVNVVKKHTKPNPEAEQKGGIVDKVMAIHRSNVMLYNAASAKRSRIGIKLLSDGSKARIFQSTQELVDV